MSETIFAGTMPLKQDEKKVNGFYVDIDGEQFYRIENYEQMPPFFMSIVSDSDHWMFISSNGALTAGRINPDNALFPYYTDDRIHDSHDQTGSTTIIIVRKESNNFLWEPFSARYGGIYSVQRFIYKNTFGNKLMLEEINNDLGIVFRYAWLNSEKFGFIKQSIIFNKNDSAISVKIIDAIQKMLPYGIDRRFQLEYSTLADGYKRNELLPETGLGLFRMSSIPTDKAEPSEALKVTTVWSTGLESSKLLSSQQLDKFRKGLPVEQETDVKAARGAYFVNAEIDLAGKTNREWFIAADINKDSADVAALNQMIQQNNIHEQLLQDVAAGTNNLIKIVANADGLQKTADELSSMRHFSNVLFNVMRGGIFDDSYTVTSSDFISFIKNANKPLAQSLRNFLDALPETLHYAELLSLCSAQANPTMEKLCYEYMPLTFGRRHGDPSRPWNIFAIEIKDEHGDKILNYQGNWRDIFQNWEALALSFPDYIESMICKFVNASTVDGYNPYRVTRDGFDWEELDPNDAWSYIGYWGDHQIIYLQKLLELSAKYHPDKLESFLAKDIFAYANVPYRQKPYEQLVIDPQNTIDFDAELDEAIKKRVEHIGADGKFVWDKNDNVYHVNLTEKILVTMLSKLSNFIPEAGIWMNTQRPEWNDANNALVGNGVSMVTLYYLRRFLNFCRELFDRTTLDKFDISLNVSDMFLAIKNAFIKHMDVLDGKISDTNRKKILDALGSAGSHYRLSVYAGFSEERKEMSSKTLAVFCDLALKYIDHSIQANKRDDDLYHAYNLIKVQDGDKIVIRYLYEMLEGQVAALSSGTLSPNEALKVLDALRASSLYREDQNSYILYPNRDLPRFMEKNTIPAQFVNSCELFQKMLKDGDKRIINRDVEGHVHFNGEFRNARLLHDALNSLEETSCKPQLEKAKQRILDVFEETFDHQSFTGRSGTFYKYEGLGSIYWHMVSKLQLAVAEIYEQTVMEKADPVLLKGLAAHYYEIREGVGVHKSPELYGAFPTDPYSHTPGFAGVQQPGMTGQVKEDILTRYMELGVTISGGRVRFSGDLLKRSEFIPETSTFAYLDISGENQQINLEQNCLAFTVCQVPVIYHIDEKARIELSRQDGSTERIEGLHMDRETSEHVFTRTGEISRMDVFLTPAL